MKTIHNGNPETDTFPLTTDPGLGAPGRPGELFEWFSPTYGRQIYLLALNDSGSAIAVHKAAKLTGAWTVAASDANVRLGNFAGVAQVAVGDDEWGWFLVGGRGKATLAASSAKDAPIYAAATANLDDAGTESVGVQLGATIGAGAAAVAEVLLTAHLGQ